LLSRSTAFTGILSVLTVLTHTHTHTYAQLEDKGVIGQMVPPTVQGLAVLLGQTSEETLHLTLETLLVVLSTAGEVLLHACPSGH
jgi:hypothetical protein